MRTTIEIDDEKLVKLKKLAAERGERGFSGLIDEALDRYLANGDDAERARRERQKKAVLALEGAWGEEEAEAVRERIKESRKSWR